MTKLTTKQRKKLHKSEFAGPDKSYPIPDRSHAANAKARASQAVNAGRMSKSQEEKIDAKADKVLGEKHSKKEEMKESKAHKAMEMKVGKKAMSDEKKEKKKTERRKKEMK